MTEPELTAHLKAWLDAVPESKVSARQAALSALEELERMRRRLIQLERIASSREAIMLELGTQMTNAAERWKSLDVVEQLGVEVRPATLVPLRLVRKDS